LRIELQLQVACKILLLEQFVLADVGGDHLPDLAALQQVPQSEPQVKV